MVKKRNRTRNRHGMQVLTLCISTTLVLILLGLVVFSVLTTRNLSDYVKENLTVTVMLGDDMSVNEGHTLCRNLYHRHICKHIDYIGKDEALREQTKAMGTDPSEFIGANPFVATLEMHLIGTEKNSQGDGCHLSGRADGQCEQQPSEDKYCSAGLGCTAYIRVFR